MFARIAAENWFMSSNWFGGKRFFNLIQALFNFIKSDSYPAFEAVIVRDEGFYSWISKLEPFRKKKAIFPLLLFESLVVSFSTSVMCFLA